MYPKLKKAPWFHFLRKVKFNPFALREEKRLFLRVTKHPPNACQTALLYRPIKYLREIRTEEAMHECRWKQEKTGLLAQGLKSSMYWEQRGSKCRDGKNNRGWSLNKKRIGKYITTKIKTDVARGRLSLHRVPPGLLYYERLENSCWMGEQLAIRILNTLKSVLFSKPSAEEDKIKRRILNIDA